VAKVGRQRRRRVRIKWGTLTNRSEIIEDMDEGGDYKIGGISNKNKTNKNEE
jgi:hypothetical protein